MSWLLAGTVLVGVVYQVHGWPQQEGNAATSKASRSCETHGRRLQSGRESGAALGSEKAAEVQPASLTVAQPGPSAVSGLQESRKASTDRPLLNSSSSTAKLQSGQADTAESGDDQTASETEEEIPGEMVLQLVRQKLIDYQPFKLRLSETVVVGRRKLQLKGTYVQGQSLRLRLELNVRVGSTQAERLDVCDGQVLFTQVRIGDKVRVTRRDVKQILKTAVSKTQKPEHLLVAELGLGGLPALLAAIERYMELEPARTETVRGRTFVVVRGKLKQQWRQWFSKKAGLKHGRLPEQVPEAVCVYFDDAYFPRRVLYLKERDGRLQPMAALDFNQVVLRTTVSEEMFRFIPPEGILPVDMTDQFLEQLTDEADAAAAASNSRDNGHD